MNAAERFPETVGDLRVALDAFQAAATDEQVLEGLAADINLAVRSLGLDYFTFTRLNPVDADLQEEVMTLMETAKDTVRNLPVWSKSISDKIHDMCGSNSSWESYTAA